MVTKTELTVEYRQLLLYFRKNREVIGVSHYELGILERTQQIERFLEVELDALSRFEIGHRRLSTVGWEPQTLADDRWR